MVKPAVSEAHTIQGSKERLVFWHAPRREIGKSLSEHLVCFDLHCGEARPRTEVPLMRERFERVEPELFQEKCHRVLCE
ncbi:hypothetical protein ES703_16737 [subsurface metagenome]